MNFDGPNYLLTRDDLEGLVGEEALAAVDADPNSLFRLQQDARLSATYTPTAALDGEVEALVNDSGSDTNAALSATYAGVEKFDNGGAFLKPVRVPVLGVSEQWPNPRNPYNLLWSEGNTRYAVGRDSTLLKSLDQGVTWTKCGYNSLGFNAFGCFLKLGTGTLLNISSAGGNNRIQRSTDDGATWTTVYTFRPNLAPLGSQGWAIHPVTGHIYVGEYGVNQDDIQVLRSTDDGATWVTFATWPGENVSGANPTTYIRHVHAITADPVAGRIVISTGDGTPATGLWRDNAAGDGVEPIVTNSMLSGAEFDAPRSIGIIPFPDYIAWAADTAGPQSYVFRMHRNQIGQPNPVIERIYRLNSAAWWTCKASDDGSTWVVSASNEGGATALDKMVHLYAITDQGSTVWEVGSVPAVGSILSGSLQPIGPPDMHGSQFAINTRGITGRSTQYRLELGRGNVAAIPAPNIAPDVPVTFTASSPAVQVPPLGEVIIGHSRAPGLGRFLRVFEVGTHIIDDGAGVSAGSQRIRIRKVGTAHFAEYLNGSDRYTRRQEGGGYLDSYTMTGGDTIEFYLYNASGTETTTLTGSVTYGWGFAT